LVSCFHFFLFGFTPGKRYYFRAAIVAEEQDPWPSPSPLVLLSKARGVVVIY